MQAAATISNRNFRGKSLSIEDNGRPINVPSYLYRKLLDFLEDKWESKVMRVKNVFFSKSHPDKPIAWLNSQDRVTIVLIDHESGKRNQIQIRIEDIELPKVIRLEYNTYRNLLSHLIRASNGGVVRWLNKIYSVRTGTVLAEIKSPQKIKLFQSQGLFGVSREVELTKYAPIQVAREEYIHLLNFLEQERGEEVGRVGNAFYGKAVSDTVLTALNSPSTMEPEMVHLMRTKVVAELVSQDSVRLRDGTIKRISELVLTKRVHINHLYYCSSCQCFVRIPRRTNIHERGSDEHPTTYVSSDVVVLPISKREYPKRQKTDFPVTIYRFWGIEDGRVAKRQTTRISKKEPLLPLIPRVGTVVPVKQTTVTKSMLLYLAHITVDSHVVTNEEKVLALQRLEGEDDRIPEIYQN